MKNTKEIKIENQQFETINQMLDSKYGTSGTNSREKFNRETILFMISEMIKEERKKQHLTQEDLANKLGTKKQYISRIENAKLDIQISTFINIIEKGLGKHLQFTLI